MEACGEWEEKEVEGSYDITSGTGYSYKAKRNYVTSRFCRQEASTRQFLGWESGEVARLIKEGKIKEAERAEGFEIVKHFRY